MDLFSGVSKQTDRKERKHRDVRSSVQLIGRSLSISEEEVSRLGMLEEEDATGTMDFGRPKSQSLDHADMKGFSLESSELLYGGNNPQKTSFGDYQGFNELETYSMAHHKPLRTRKLSFSEEFSHRHIVLALVGLPARGKSYIAKKVLNYGSWRGHSVKVFNVGAFRRTLMDEQVHLADFFDPTDASKQDLRDGIAKTVLSEAVDWLQNRGGQIAIFDATNTTRRRRKMVRDFCCDHGVRVLFIESVCDEEEVLRSNIRTKIAKSPDYASMSENVAMEDLRRRIVNYEKAYETISDEEDISYVKLINIQSTVICHHVKGYFPRLLVFFLMNLRVKRRPIWLVRAGQCDSSFRIGEENSHQHAHSRDCPLGLEGIEFAKRLAKFAEEHRQDDVEAWDSPMFDQGDYIVWSSTLRRAEETVQFVPKHCMQWTALNMLDMGIFEGWTLEDLENEKEEVFHAWRENMKSYRFPGGESYNDIAERLEPLIMDVEAQLKPILIVSHLSCLRVLYAYFQGKTLYSLPETDIPRHAVIEMIPTQYGWQERVHDLMKDDRWKVNE